MEIMIALGLFALLLFGFARVIHKLKHSRTAGTVPGSSPDYIARSSILSRAEMNFFRVLQLATPENGILLASVRMADVLQPAISRKTDQKRFFQLFGKISQKQLDFLLCDSTTSRPVLAIELQDASHNSERRRQRDAFVTDALHQAGIPVLLVRTARDYSVETLRQQITELLPTETSAAGVGTSE